MKEFTNSDVNTKSIKWELSLYLVYIIYLFKSSKIELCLVYFSINLYLSRYTHTVEIEEKLQN